MQGSIKLLNRGRIAKEPTKVIRVPADKIEAIHQFLEEGGPCTVPLYSSKIPAGFPNPADDSIDDKIDLNKLLVEKQAATYLLEVSGDSMIEEGIFPGDLLIVDRSLEAVHGNIVIAELDGEATVKKLYKKDEIIKLLPANKAYKPIEIKGKLEIWGVVTRSIRFHKGR